MRSHPSNTILLQRGNPVSLNEFYFDEASVVKVKINKYGCLKANASFMRFAPKIARQVASVSEVLLEYLVKRTYRTFIESLVIFLATLPFDRCYLVEPWKRKLFPKVAKPPKNRQAVLGNDFLKAHSKIFRSKWKRIRNRNRLFKHNRKVQFFLKPFARRFYFNNNLHANSWTI